VIRSIFVIGAIMISGATFTTSAEACISCNYVPEVLRQPSARFYAPPYGYYAYPSYDVRVERRDRTRRHARQRQPHAIRRSR